MTSAMDKPFMRVLYVNLSGSVVIVFVAMP